MQMKYGEKNIINRRQSFFQLAAFILTVSCVKLIYDYLVLNALPKVYMFSLSYGVDFSSDNQVAAWIVFFFVSFFTWHLAYFDNLSFFGIKLLFLLYYIPINSSYYLNDSSVTFMVLSTVFWMNFVIAAYFFLPKEKVDESNQVYQIKWDEIANEKLMYILCLIICLACVAYGYRYNGLKLTLNITSIYADRAAFVGSTNEFQSILFHFGGSVIVPLSMLYALNKRKPLLLSCGLISALAIFSIARQKGDLFSIILVLGSFLVVKMNLLKKVSDNIHYISLLMLLFVYVQFKFFNSDALFMLFIRRMMYVPAWITNLYYDFFSINEHLYFTQDVFLINRFFDNRMYSESVLSLIDKAYFNHLMPSPNSGLFSEAYMHLGVLGALFYPFLMIFLFKFFFDCLKCYSRDCQLFFSMSFMLALLNIPLSSGVFCITYFLFIPFTFFVVKINQR